MRPGVTSAKNGKSVSRTICMAYGTIQSVFVREGSTIDSFLTRLERKTMEKPLVTNIPFNQTEILDRFVFGWLDYALFGLLLLVSVLIGVYFGFFSKQDSTTEYLLGGKRMGCFPVAMSIIARSVRPSLPFDKRAD